MIRKILWVVAIIFTALPVVKADMTCGDDGTTCTSEERCYEHVVATFSGDQALSPPYVQGQCAPKEQKSAEFWCGNRHCQSGLFGTPSVCCIQTPEQGAPQYTCAYNELSCPGNTQQLSIRESQPNRTLQRG